MSQTQPSLRDRFLGRTAAAREQFDVILDEDLAEAVDSAQSAVDTIESRITLLEQQRRDLLAAAHRARKSGATPTNPVEDIDKTLTESRAELGAAQKELDAATAKARPETVRIVFRRIAPDRYNELVASSRNDDGDLDLVRFRGPLLAEAYVATVNPATGDDLGVSWDEARAGGVTDGDMDRMFSGVLMLCRKSSTHPSQPRRSGT